MRQSRKSRIGFRKPVVLAGLVLAMLAGALVAQAKPWAQIGVTHSGPAAMQTAVAGKEAKVNQWMTPVPGAPPPAPKRPLVPCPALSRADVPDAGQIINPAEIGTPLPFPSMTYRITTMVQDVRGNLWLTVYAGAEWGDTSQGVLIVWERNQCTGEQGDNGTFLSARKVGALTLTGLAGNIVSFSYSGGTGTFDLASHKFSLP